MNNGNSTFETSVPGAETQYYREVWEGLPDDGESKYPGLNAHPYTIFALRTRVEHDHKVSKWNIKNRGRVKSRRLHYNNRMTYFLVLNRVKDGKIESVNKKWLQSTVDFWTTRYPDYCAVLSDKYPTGLNPKKPLPEWWINEILPRFDITEIFRKSLFPEKKNPDIDNYDWFYDSGTIYVQLVDPDNIENTGGYTPLEGDLLSTGEQAVFREEGYYGDYSRYKERFLELQYQLVKELEKMYHQGVMPLDPNMDSELIENWNLIPHSIHPELFLPNWLDHRITGFDGVVNTLRRQSSEWKSHWDNKIIFTKISQFDVVKHNLATWYAKKFNSMPLFVGDLMLFRVENYTDCVEILDNITEISSTSFGLIEVTNSHFSEAKIQELQNSGLKNFTSRNVGIFVDLSYGNSPLLTNNYKY